MPHSRLNRHRIAIDQGFSKLGDPSSWLCFLALVSPSARASNDKRRKLAWLRRKELYPGWRHMPSNRIKELLHYIDIPSEAGFLGIPLLPELMCEEATRRAFVPYGAGFGWRVLRHSTNRDSFPWISWRHHCVGRTWYLAEDYNRPGHPGRHALGASRQAR